ncbi:MAG: hypothetical protein FD127_2009 [Acidimicrobiaceae bacterium]|nr:MAG: hypothetical protein FD127_2009 [Acidimicrobiaceae bacterium]
MVLVTPTLVVVVAPTLVVVVRGTVVVVDRGAVVVVEAMVVVVVVVVVVVLLVLEETVQVIPAGESLAAATTVICAVHQLSVTPALVHANPILYSPAGRVPAGVNAPNDIVGIPEISPNGVAAGPLLLIALPAVASNIADTKASPTGFGPVA